MNAIKKITKMIDGNKQTTSVEYNVPPMEEIPNADNSRMASSMAPPEGHMGYDHPGDPKGKDTIPAWLSAGEAVIPKEAVDKFPQEVDRLIQAGRSIQDGRQPVYATEGFVDKYPELSGANWRDHIDYEALADALAIQETGNAQFPKGRHFDPNTETGLVTGDAGELGKYQILESTARDSGFPDLNFDLLAGKEKDHRKFSIGYLKAIAEANKTWSLKDVIRAYNVGFPRIQAAKAGDISRGVDKHIGFDNTAYVDPLLSRYEDEGWEDRLADLGQGVVDFTTFLPKKIWGALTDDNVKMEMENEIITNRWKNERARGIPPGSPQSMFTGLATPDNYLDQYRQGAIDEKGELPLINEDGNIVANTDWGKRPPEGIDEWQVANWIEEDPDLRTIWGNKSIPNVPTIAEIAANKQAEKSMKEAGTALQLSGPMTEYEADTITSGSFPTVTNVNTTDGSGIQPADILNDIIENTNDSSVVDGNDVNTKIKDEEDNRGFWEKARDKMFEVLGNALDEEALAKMALNYGATRMLGYDHSTSLNFAAKEYNTYAKQKQKQIDQFILDNAEKYKPSSLNKFRRTHDMDHLEPVETTTLFDVKKPGTSLYDRWTGNRIDMNVNSEGVEWAYVDGKPTTWGAMSAIQTEGTNTPRFTKWVDKEHNSDVIVDTWRGIAKQIIDDVHKTFPAEDYKNRLGADENTIQVAQAAEKLLANLKIRFGASNNNSRAIKEKLSSAISKYYKARLMGKNGQLQKGRIVESLEPFLDAEFITFKTDVGLEPKDTKGVYEINLSKLYQTLSDAAWDDDIVKHEKKLGYIIKQHKQLWGAVKSHGAYDNPPEGWSPFTYWLSHMFIRNATSGEVDVPMETLEAVYTTDSIVAFQKAMEANPSPSKKEQNEMRKLLKFHTNK